MFWLNLKFTGLSATIDHILEVAMVVSDGNLETGTVPGGDGGGDAEAGGECCEPVYCVTPYRGSRFTVPQRVSVHVGITINHRCD